MGIPWLRGAKWADWTRDERYFCAVLFGHADRDHNRFARWVIDEAKLGDAVPAAAEWEVGYEVCFYRDYLWEREELEGTELPLKRTFDLCLFAPKVVIVIEAKGFEGFSSKQNAEFVADRDRLQGLLGADVAVHLVALASSSYVTSDRLGEETLAPFSGRPLTWKAAYQAFGDDRLRHADGLYRREPGSVGRVPARTE